MHRSLVLTAALALALVLGVSGCASDSTDEVRVPAAAGAGTTLAAGATVDAVEFAAALEAADTVVLDVRTPAEFADGHLPGAVNLDVEAPDFAARVGSLDPSLTYAVYCRSGNRSQVALDIMLRSGFSNVYHLAGGIGAWQQAGGEVITSPGEARAPTP